GGTVGPGIVAFSGVFEVGCAAQSRTLPAAPSPREVSVDATPTSNPAAGVTEGSIVPATVTRVDASAAMVSFGWKVEAGVPLDEFPRVSGKPSVKVGDKFEVWVEWLADDAKEIILSKDKAQKLRRYEELVGICEQGGPIEGTVLSRDGKGYQVDIGLP